MMVYCYDTGLVRIEIEIAYYNNVYIYMYIHLTS